MTEVGWDAFTIFAPLFFDLILSRVVALALVIDTLRFVGWLVAVDDG